ncbi:MAG TPA: hypothetical protein ENI07_11470 [Desulfobacterales bacterium]|nr:hypothetical protein [Desulfobacterales bacterium]
MLKASTKRQIDKAVGKTLKEAGMREPPFLVEDLLDHLELGREFYDLEDPGLLRRFWHKVEVRGKTLQKIIKTIKLAALWLPDTGRERILIDETLPAPKKNWASFHDTAHSILEWHRPFFLGDTAQTLDPDFQEALEADANYGASGLMFGGEVFTRDALDTKPEWDSIDALKKAYKTSWVTTLRRYVEFSRDIPMALTVSTPWWEIKPDDQEHRCRHFIKSGAFKIQFSVITQDILKLI